MISEFYRHIVELVTNPAKCRNFMILIILVEIVLNGAIVKFVPYTEIDWKAYMQEVEGYLNGSTNYFELKGDTGPLVYPGGFVYLYSIIYYFTDQGSNLELGQQIFAVLYLIQLCLVFLVYLEVVEQTRFPPWMLLFLSLTGYRVHSIFSLRMFNDGPATILVWISILLFLKRHWIFGSIFYSLSVSVKMNNLLFAPALGVIYVRNLGIVQTVGNLGICALVQVATGFEFLSTYPYEYINRAFQFDRKFFYKWTVNFRFMSEELFLDSRLHILLLFLHLFFLVIFCAKKWMPKKFGTRLVKFPTAVLNTIWNSGKEKTCNLQMIVMLFTSNYIGMVFARSLHYQFYVWYYHTLPLLVHISGIGAMGSILVLLSIEYCWNIFPSTSFSSSLLVLIHLFILIKLYYAPWPAVKKAKSS